MNMKKTIIAILGIALIAIVSVGAVSADESLENVGCVLTPSVSEHTYEKGILTIPISNNACGDLNDIPGLEAIGAWDYTPAPIPTPTRDACGYFHNGDFPKAGFSDAFPFGDCNGVGRMDNVFESCALGFTPYNGNDDQPSVYDVDGFNPAHPEPTIILVGSADDTTSMEFGDI